MRRTAVFIFLVSGFLLACNETANEVSEGYDTPASSKQDSSQTNVYFDYQDTRLANDFTDTVLAKFSDDNSEDCFSLFVPNGLISETQSVLRITSAEGVIVYEHIFPTSDLVNGYATATIHTDDEMIAHVLQQARSILQDGIIQPAGLSDESYLNQAAKEDFVDYDLFVAIRNTERNIFHYCLNEESHYYLGFSEKQGKAVPIIYCC